jgi:Kinesin motor domain
MGRMFLVDLAGSERLKKSKSVGLRAQEAKAINLSLTMLGMCVNAKSDPNATHIPYRDSKLTRLLQESLGGNAKTSMIIAVSDTKEHSDETFQSLVFGSRAILVKTAPRVNAYVDLSVLNEKIASQLQVRCGACMQVSQRAWTLCARTWLRTPHPRALRKHCVT